MAPFILIGIVILFVVAGGAYYLGSRNSTAFLTSSIPQATTAPTLVPSQSPFLRLTTTPVVIPKNWKSFTARDPAFGVETTLSLPPGYRFEFTGSETSILSDSNSPEVWDYSSSVFIGKQGVKNYYNGESRRAWYQDLLNGKFKPISDVFPPEKILAVTEYSIGQSSYLKLTVDIGSGMKRTDYLYVQNNIVHVLKEASERASSMFSPVGMNIGVVFVSLTSRQFNPVAQ